MPSPWMPSTAPAQAPPAADRSNNFNLARFLLATLVILSHSPELIDGDRHREPLTRAFGTLSFGELAVDGFFLLSGFLILQSWERDPRLGVYLTKRALRIYPGFLVASLACAFLLGPLGSPDPAHFLTQIPPARFAASLLGLQMPALPAAFPGWPYPIVNGAMWTIAYEARCYLLVALLGCCGLAGRRPVWLAIAGAAFSLAGLYGPLEGLKFPGSGWLFGEVHSLMRLVGFFAAGACFYLARGSLAYKATPAAVAVLLLMPCLMASTSAAELGLATFGAYALFWFVFAPLPLLARFRTLPDVSYGIYLYGWPIQKLVIHSVPGISPAATFGLSFALACGAGWLSWTGVEARFLRRKRREAPEAGRSSSVLAPIAAPATLTEPA